jgi:hypothetical protein
MTHVPQEAVLPKLDGLRKTAADRWIAKCPAHEDRHPSLSIKACEDGTLLMKCRSRQCDLRDIVHAIGLELRDLFARRVTDRRRAYEHELAPWQFEGRSRKDKLPVSDALQLIRLEMYVVLICANDMVRGVEITVQDLDRLGEAVCRIENICGDNRVGR